MPPSGDWADTSVRRVPSARRAQRMRRLTGSTRSSAGDGDDDEQGEEVDLHHLLLAEDGTEHGEQHVSRHAPDNRGHRLQPDGTFVDGRRGCADGIAEQAAHQGAQAEGVGSTRSKAKPDQNPTTAPGSGP